MLTITVGMTESFDDEKQEFVSLGGTKLELEHSLVSLSKWESYWEKPFLGPEKKTDEETISYVKMMVISDDVPADLFEKFTSKDIDAINYYIEAKMTATWFAEDQTPSTSREVITAEVIYYFMVALTIPFECQHWHLNRLLTLIRVCNEKNNPKSAKKMSRQDLAARNRALNAERKAKYSTSG